MVCVYVCVCVCIWPKTPQAGAVKGLVIWGPVCIIWVQDT